MAQQTIGIGTVANDGTGDPIRTAFDKTNDNFDELYAADTALDGRVTTLEGGGGGGGGASALDDLTDVDTTGAGDGDVLTFDGSGWVPEVPAIAPAFRGALVKLAADATGLNLTAGTTPLDFGAEEYDTSAFHDNTTNSSRLTIPAGISRVRLSAQVALANVTADGWCLASIRKNGSSSWGFDATVSTEGGLGSPRLNCSTPAINVTAGDYFDVIVQTESDTSVDITALRSWFAIEAIAVPAEVEALPLTFNFTDTGEARFYADVAMTLTEQATSGTGTIAYEKSTSAAPSTFSSTTSPITLEAGAWLKVSASAVTTIVAVHLKRTA